MASLILRERGNLGDIASGKQKTKGSIERRQEEPGMPDLHDDLITLPTQEEQYAVWVAAHPHGHVINAHKTHSVQMLWHRADCGHIQPDGILHWVTGSYLKACSLNAGALAVWAKGRPEALTYCQTCRDTWIKEQGAP
jgi:hypothetical protein